MTNLSHPRRSLRLILALLMFVGLTTLGVGLVVKKQGSQTFNQHAFTKKISTTPDDDGFFYQSLGEVPTEPQDRSEGGSYTVVQPSGYTVEIAASDRQLEAERLLDRLKEQGVAAYYTPLSYEGRIVYRVRKGLYPSAAQAQGEAKNLAKVLGKEPQVVKLE